MAIFPIWQLSFRLFQRLESVTLISSSFLPVIEQDLRAPNLST